MTLLTAATVGRFLAERGLAGPSEEPVELGGGVSNVVFAVRSGTRELVVKQALPRLRVAALWEAKPERALNEAAALRLAAQVTPGSVPRVVDVDEGRCALVIERAPSSWRPWKEHLLEGVADAAIAAQLGEILTTWQRASWADAGAAARFDDYEAFEQLRIDPYHRTVALRFPELAAAVGAQVEALRSTRLCLVHGDFSPKNVLVGTDGLWVIDFEVAHYGNPLFDVAFLLTHLLLKAIRRPDRARGYERCSRAFLASYGNPVREAHLLGQLGCLLAARADGKSPVEYLDEAGRARARALGRLLLLEPPASIDAVWSRL